MKKFTWKFLLAAALMVWCAPLPAALAQKAPATSEMAVISLPGGGSPDKMWSYELSREGIAAEVSLEEYLDLQKRECEAAKTDKNDPCLVDLVPGNRLYVFKGLEPGRTEVSLFYADPTKKGDKAEMTAVYKLEVAPDLKAAAVKVSSSF